MTAPELAHGASSSLAEDVLDGLTRPFKELPAKHLYDARGSELFERITELPEYYPTRTELAILRDSAADMLAATGARELVEIGSGAATKARILLGAGDVHRYIPFDVSEHALTVAAADLAEDFPAVDIRPIAGDFERDLHRIPPASGPRLVAFLGSTLGNFAPGSRRRFLRTLATLLGPDDHLLLGVDLVKDVATLEAAYDDAAGVTAEFNRNVLHVLNRELGADFEPELFEHVAFYDLEHEWVEMRLRARQTCRVTIAALELELLFRRGEEIRTEISAKFTWAQLERDLRAAGLRLERWFTDRERRFAVTVARR